MTLDSVRKLFIGLGRKQTIDHNTQGWHFLQQILPMTGPYFKKLQSDFHTSRLLLMIHMSMLKSICV
jgi:hypothetical protein